MLLIELEFWKKKSVMNLFYGYKKHKTNGHLEVYGEFGKQHVVW